MTLLKHGLMVLSMAVLVGCTTNKTVDAPAKLVNINPVLNINRLWSERLGDGAEYLRLPLQPTVLNGVVYAAGYKGRVVALDADTGRHLWQTNTNFSLSAGPALGEGLVVVGGTDGVLLALSSDTGEERWRYQLSSEPLSKALVAKGMVVVRTVDGVMLGLNASNGTVRWTYQGTVPKLSLRGTASPVLAERANAVVEGFDDGRLVALDITTGDVLWAVTIDKPSGRTELDRLADIDATAAVVGKDVYVAGYHGKVALLDLDNGQVWWSKDASSYRGFGLDDKIVFLVSANGEVLAIRRTDGNQQWQQSALMNRALSAPAQLVDSLIVGDFEGYVHWLNKLDGSIQARASTDGERITNAPVVADGRVYVQTDGGRLTAFEIEPKN